MAGAIGRSAAIVADGMACVAVEQSGAIIAIGLAVVTDGRRDPAGGPAIAIGLAQSAADRHAVTVRC